MRLHLPGRSSGRRATIIVQAVLVTAALLGMTGIVVDGGLMMAAQRAAQNAADAAAMAAAYELKRGDTSFEYRIESATSRIDGFTGKIQVPRATYSFRMSF